MTAASAPFTVRRVGPTEWELHRTVRLEALAADPLAFGSTLAREQAYPEELWRERTLRASGSEESSLWLAVAPEGRAVGLIAASLVEREFHIFAMWVEKSWRRRGVGGALLDTVLTWIAGRDPSGAVRLDVNPRQHAAVALYESRGFERTGTSEPLPHTPGETVVAMTRPGGYGRTAGPRGGARG